MKKKLVDLMKRLTGQKVPFKNAVKKLPSFKSDNIVHYNQFNELLLMLGYDRITKHFFEKFFGVDEVTIGSLEKSIMDFQKKAMLLYGNVKFGFKKLSSMKEKELTEKLEETKPIDIKELSKRPEPLDPINEINSDDTYLLGHVIQKEIEQKAKGNPKDNKAQEELKKMEEIVNLGTQNLYRYLTYDYMDVYVATSMRKKHEYILVNQFIKNLSSHKLIRPLKLRFFDPTQAYCSERIDKGLVEGLMLKRAKCTIYSIQESDTFGKDSELAATLAQGKPVIAYIPELKNKNEFIADALSFAEKHYPDKSLRELIFEQLQLYYPNGAWEDKNIQKWISNPDVLQGNEVGKAKNLLYEKAKETYNKRAEVIKDMHPLGLQVNLANGVANGVLVVRSVEHCAQLLRSIVLKQMEFVLEKGKDGTLKLIEKISNSVYRVVTSDEKLTNSFWNFYLK